VTQPITDGKIECKTDAELSTPKYSGNIFLFPRIQQFDINDSVIYYVRIVKQLFILLTQRENVSKP
jgi:hypothetical protein